MVVIQLARTLCSCELLSCSYCILVVKPQPEGECILFWEPHIKLAHKGCSRKQCSSPLLSSITPCLPLVPFLVLLEQLKKILFQRRDCSNSNICRCSSLSLIETQMGANISKGFCNEALLTNE